MGARAFIPVALIGAVLLTFAPSAATPASAAGPTSEAQQIIAIAKKQIGDPWRHGATGPKSFDCSGLVTYAFRKAGDYKTIGAGKYRSARALYRYFKARGLADRKDPKPGDLVIWGRGTHVGIYIGKGKAISTLTSGVRIHKVHAVRAKFTAYLHTGMWKKGVDGGSTMTTQSTDTTPVTTASSLRPEMPVTDAGRSTTSTSTTPTTGTATAAAEIRSTQGRVNFRKGPSVRYAIIRTLRDDTRLVVLDRTQDARGRTWIKVRVGTRVGWVARWLTTAS
jgi:hypothetical protein